MNKFAIGGFAVVLAAIGVWQFYPRPATAPSVMDESVAPSATSTASATPTGNVITPAAVTTSQKPTNLPVAHPLPIAAGDHIVSWEFKGVYTGNPELVAKTESEITRLTNELKTATSSAMILSVSIANQYELLGKGKEQYGYLGLAIQADKNHSLPWHNLGVMMERLGAYKTARIAYETATKLQSDVRLYHYAYLEFLIARMKDDTVAIEKAFASAESTIGTTSYLSELRTEWEKS